MFKHTDTSDAGTGTIVAVFVALLFIGLFAASAVAITSIQPSEHVSEGEVRYDLHEDGEMNVEASIAHNVDYLVVKTSDGDSHRLHEEGNSVVVDSNGDNVEVFKVVDGRTEHIQTLTYYDHSQHWESTDSVGGIGA